MSMPPAPPRSSASPPSISQMLWLWRSPLTLMVKLAATEVGVLLSGRAELTPRPSAANAAKLRFSVAILADLLGTDQGADHVRVGLHRQRVRLDSHRLRFGTHRQLDVNAQRRGYVHHDAVLLECLEALGGDLQVVVCGVKAVDVVQTGRAAFGRFGDPVAGSVSVTVAPATTAPVWSVTMPVSSELACANAPTHANTKNNGNRKNLYLACLM